jgi:hypothetical protein
VQRAADLTGIRIPSVNNYCRQCIVVVPERHHPRDHGLPVTTRGTRRNDASPAGIQYDDASL